MMPNTHQWRKLNKLLNTQLNCWVFFIVQF
nr:MAG TPA: hypothetical protein [Caudoviricetes sp.]